mmetsp:Transcript_22024/g.62582  ORF Transcript_22024/g.62582 Transcript_22024/m.62582 type:complete len:105 (+) Transcript_22024:71-385(+)
MSSAVGDQSQLRQRKAAAEAESRSRDAVSQQGGEADTLDPIEREYVEYFRNKYGDNPRTDFLGIDGMALFCVIYIVVAGVVLSILYFSVYARTRNLFTSGSEGK